MRKQELQFVIAYALAALLLGSALGFYLAHLSQVRNYICPVRECAVCDRSDCL